MLAPQAAWDACLDEIRKNVIETEFSKWFEPIKAFDLQGSALTIKVPSAYFTEILEKRYLNELTVAIRKVLGEKAQLKR